MGSKKRTTKKGGVRAKSTTARARSGATKAGVPKVTFGGVIHQFLPKKAVSNLETIANNNGYKGDVGAYCRDVLMAQSKIIA